MIKECQYCHFYFEAYHGGACRRYPPQLGSQTKEERSDRTTEEAFFSQVSAYDWCGEYEKNHHHEDQAASRSEIDAQISAIAKERISLKRARQFEILFVFLLIVWAIIVYFK